LLKKKDFFDHHDVISRSTPHPPLLHPIADRCIIYMLLQSASTSTL
jgi:hypothetical protein